MAAIVVILSFVAGLVVGVLTTIRHFEKQGVQLDSLPLSKKYKRWTEDDL